MTNADASNPDAPRSRVSRFKLPALRVPRVKVPKLRIPSVKMPKLSMPDVSHMRVAPKRLALIAFGALALLLLIPAFIGAVRTDEATPAVQIAAVDNAAIAARAPEAARAVQAPVEVVAPVAAEAVAVDAAAQPVLVEAAPADAAAIPADAAAAPQTEIIILAPTDNAAVVAAAEAAAAPAQAAPAEIVAAAPQIEMAPVVVEEPKRNAISRFFAPLGEWIFGKDEVEQVTMAAAVASAEVAAVEAVAVEAVPAEAVAVEAVAVEAIPAEAVAVEAVAVEAIPAEAVAVEAVAVEAVAVEAVAVEAVAVEAAPAVVEVKRPNAVARFFAPLTNWVFGKDEVAEAEVAVVAASAGAAVEPEVAVEEKQPNAISRFFAPLGAWIWGESDEQAAMADVVAGTDPLAGVQFDGCIFVSSFEQPAQGDPIPSAGWTIGLYDVTATQVVTGMTDVDGELLFSNLPFGVYTVTEEARTGWITLSDPSVPVTLTTTACPQVDFINQQIPQTVCIEATLPGGASDVEVRASPVITGGYTPAPEISDANGTVRFILPFDDPTVPGADYNLCATGADNVTIWCALVTAPDTPGACASAPAFEVPAENVVLSSVAEPAAAAISCRDTYTVRGGDGLYWIAQRHGVSPKDIVAANPWVRNRYNLYLYRGEQICIP